MIPMYRGCYPILLFALFVFTDGSSSGGEERLASEARTPLRLAVLVSPELEAEDPLGQIMMTLDDRKSLQWVDRTQIDQIVTERKITTLFDPVSLSHRQSVARLLAADMLVMIRPRERDGAALPPETSFPDKPAPHDGTPLQFLMVDCRYGIRLADEIFPHRKIVFTQCIPERIDQIAKMYADGVEHILGLVPLVAEGQQGRIEQLHTGLPRLLEKILIRHAGMVAFDAEQCRLIEQERLAGMIPETSIPISLVQGTYSVEFSGEGANIIHLDLEVLQHGKRVGNFRWEIEQDDYGSVKLSEPMLVEILDFLRDTIRVASSSPAISKTSSRWSREATINEMIEQAIRHAETGALEEVIAMGEAVLLLDPNRLDARRLLLGAYRRSEQQSVGETIIRIHKGHRVVEGNSHRCRERIEHHVEYLLRNRWMSRGESVALLRILFPHFPYHEFARPNHFQERPRPSVAPKTTENYKRRALSLLSIVEEIAPEKEVAPISRLSTYAFAPMSCRWNEQTRLDANIFETGLWVQRALEIKDNIQLLASREDGWEGWEQWGVDLEEQIVRNHHAPAELAYYLLRSFWIKKHGNRAGFLEDHPEYREKYIDLLRRLAEEESPALKLVGKAGQFSLLLHESVSTVNVHLPKPGDEKIIQRMHDEKEELLHLAMECGVIDQNQNPPMPRELFHEFLDCQRRVTQFYWLQHAARQNHLPFPRSLLHELSHQPLPNVRHSVATPAENGRPSPAHDLVTLKPIPDIDPRRWLNAFPLDDTTDVIHLPYRVCLLNASDRLETIFSTENHDSFPSPHDWIYDVHYDGQWIWILGGEFRLLAVDREGTLQAEFTLPHRHCLPGDYRKTWLDTRFAGNVLERSFLPPAMNSYRPGEVWVVGYERRGRDKETYIVRASIQPNEELKLVFRADRKAADPSLNAQFPIDISFYPHPACQIVTVGETPWLIIPRLSHRSGKLHSFLGIDLEKPSHCRVEELSEHLLNFSPVWKRSLYSYGGAFYITEGPPFQRTLSRYLVMESEASKWHCRQETIDVDRRSDDLGWIFYHGTIYHFTVSDCIAIDPNTLKKIKYKTNFKENGIRQERQIYRPFALSRWGIVLPVNRMNGTGAQFELYQVIFPQGNR